MDKYKKYYGLTLIMVSFIALGVLAWHTISGAIIKLQESKNEYEQKNKEYQQALNKQKIVRTKISRIQNSIKTAPKKIYAPVDNDLGNDTLFFTLYNDVIEMIHANSVKIRAIDYEYNPESDKFVEHGKNAYFVCKIQFDLVSNYVNLGKLIQDIYQYPYYIGIKGFEIKPYAKDKKVLLSKLTLFLYAHTSPEEN